MATYRIDFVHRSDGRAPHERVAGIGGVCGGGPWRLPVQEAIAGIERRQWAFYVERQSGRRVDVVVAETEGGQKYLTTTPDDGDSSGLLALPEEP